MIKTIMRRWVSLLIVLILVLSGCEGINITINQSPDQKEETSSKESKESSDDQTEVKEEPKKEEEPTQTEEAPKQETKVEETGNEEAKTDSDDESDFQATEEESLSVEKASEEAASTNEEYIDNLSEELKNKGRSSVLEKVGDPSTKDGEEKEVTGSLNLRETLAKTIPADLEKPSANSQMIIPWNITKWDLDAHMIPSKSKKEVPETFTKLQPNTTYTVPVDDSEVLMINRLGCGYNVFGKYADANSVGEAVLDLRRLLNEGKVEALRLNKIDSIEAISESVRGLAKKITHNAGISGSYLCFSGDVQTRFTKEQFEEEKNYFATFEKIVTKYKIYITRLRDADYKKYLTPEARDVLNDPSVDAKLIFDKYGHYVLVNSLVGGRILFTDTRKSTTVKDFKSFELSARANYNAIVAKVSAEYGLSTSSEHTSEESKKNARYAPEGGDISLISTKEALQDPAAIREWVRSLDKEGTLVGFPKDTTCLIPIWWLCDKKERADKLQEEFEKLANNIEDTLPQAKHYKKKYILAANLGMRKYEVDAREEAARGARTVLEPDLNLKAGGKYIYLGIKWGEPGDINGALTDFLVSTEYKKDLHVFDHHESSNPYVVVRKNDEASGKFSQTGCDLNYDNGKELYLYACFDYSMRKAPIYDIMVYDATAAVEAENEESNDENCLKSVKEFAKKNEWEIIHYAHSNIPADLNRGAGGHYLYLLVKKDYDIIADYIMP